MRHAPVILVVWALLLSTLVGLMLILGESLLSYELLGSAAALIAVLAVIAVLVNGEQRARRSWIPIASPDLSLPAPLLAIGLTAIAVGFTVGPWLTYVGAGLTLLALTGLAREYREQRRTLRETLRALRAALGERR